MATKRSSVGRGGVGCLEMAQQIVAIQSSWQRKQPTSCSRYGQPLVSVMLYQVDGRGRAENTWNFVMVPGTYVGLRTLWLPVTLSDTGWLMDAAQPETGACQASSLLSFLFCEVCVWMCVRWDQQNRRQRNGWRSRSRFWRGSFGRKESKVEGCDAMTQLPPCRLRHSFFHSFFLPFFSHYYYHHYY